MSEARYVYTIDLDRGTAVQHVRPDALPDLSTLEVEPIGKCAIVKRGSGIAFVGAHSRCAVRLWRTRCASDQKRPNAPWVAFRGLDHIDAAAIGWSWLQHRGLSD